MIECIGQTVKAVRERLGLSIAELAHESHVDDSVLSALERGERGITTTQLDDVAAALSLEPAALLSGREIPRPVPSVFLRHRPMQDFDYVDGDALDEALEQGRILAELRTELGDTPSALQAGTFRPSEPAAHRSDAPAQDGYHLAREVRKWLGNPADPLGDVRALIEERFGIAVVVRRLASRGVTAVCVRAESAAVIVLEARDPQRAQNSLLGRVYLAHELCHALFDPSLGGLHLVIDVVLDRKALAAEQRARAFAAELLLPRQGVKEMVPDPGEVREPVTAIDLVGRVRSRFGTPHPLTVNHLCNLGVISAELRESCESGTSTFLEAPPETSLPSVGGPSLFVGHLAERAHREGFITDGEARGMLGLDSLAPLPWDAEL